MKRLLIALLFICPSAFAAYQEMLIEGVQQSNGVWTTAGVADTSGFVRTTGAVTVSGVTRNLPVTMTADLSASSALLKGASRLAGPVALAATAYELYQWYNSYGLTNANGEWGYLTGSLTFKPEVAGKVNCSYLYGTTNSTVDDCAAKHKQWYNNPTPEGGLTLDPLKNPNPSCTTSNCTWGYRQDFANNKDLVFTIVWPTSLGGQPHTDNRPATDADFNNLPLFTWPLISNNWSKFPSLTGKTPITSTDFTPYSEWFSDPYFKDGNWWRDRMDVSPAPAPGQPTRVRIDIGPVKLEGMTDPATPPAETPADTSTAPKEQTKFCDDNPQSIACQEMGKPDEAEPIKPDEKQFQLDTSQSWGAANGACPASPSVTLFTGKVLTFDYRPTCDFLALLRPIIIAFALMTALFIALGRTD